MSFNRGQSGSVWRSAILTFLFDQIALPVTQALFEKDEKVRPADFFPLCRVKNS